MSDNVTQHCARRHVMFSRTIRMVDNGIKPVYVFDGKPPTMKAGNARFSLVDTDQY